ncbi:zinc-finger domain-containing protein [Aquabacter spiritensis]|uniref:Putative Zn-finger protein n=1 Tax=Aquabacter spiritensis TaxID=933073 RepID=A0A4R3M2S1_9HYPH|nr:zinc-finger domain-containing protein [Aquabacter spiritensis]TCT05547.1 putative Zn-finger protein [Aquabacter spiritensis]
MAATGIPHFCNDLGVPVIEVGAREFMCIGATPPFDHPHIFLDMGHDTEIVCSYCSTLYRYNPALKADEARPDGSRWQERPAAA